MDMLLKYRQLYAPETETGGAAPEETTPPIPLNERPADGPGSGRGELRKQLEKSVTTERTGREAREAKDAKDPKKAPTKAAKGPNHQETPADELDDDLDEVTEVSEGSPEGEPEVKEPAPEGFTKEAKAEWAKTPANVRAAITKRVADMDKGVAEIKRSYADIDQALAPHMNEIRRHGHTPAQAVNQMFSWFQALQANPKQAFPALAQSFQFDWKSLAGGAPDPAVAAAAAAAGGQTPAAEQTPEWKAYLDQFARQIDAKFGGLTNQFQQQSMQKTQEILDGWSKDKPYFEEVRQAMAHMIQSGLVPAQANGAADLDRAYDMAVYALPEVRTKQLAEAEAKRRKEREDKRATEKAAQQEQADKARRAGSASLRGGAPGDPIQPGSKKGKAKSVRESLMEAREELSSS